MNTRKRIIIASNHELDNGGEFARALEEQRIAFDIVLLEKKLPDPTEMAGIILLGGPILNTRAKINWYKEIIKAKIPGIAICVGKQGLGEGLGGTIVDANPPEFGFENEQGQPIMFKLTEAGLADPVLGPLSEYGEIGPWFGFHQKVVQVNPETTIVLATGEYGDVQAIRSREEDGQPGKLLGVQNHPDVRTKKDLRNFIEIYKDIFGLTERKRKNLYAQMEAYEERNIGPRLVNSMIDNVFNRDSSDTPHLNSVSPTLELLPSR